MHEGIYHISPRDRKCHAVGEVFSSITFQIFHVTSGLHVMTSDGKHVLLSFANLHYALHFVVNTTAARKNVRKQVFMISSWLNLVKTTRRMDWMSVGFLTELGKRTYGSKEK